MYNPILTHRQEVINRIMKGFDADEIEKSPQNIKPFTWRISKKTGQPWRDYNSHENEKLIEGEDKVIDSGKHITINSDSLLVYNNEMRTELKRGLSAIGCVFPNNKVWRRSPTKSYYLEFKKDALSFEVRLSNHTQASEDNAVLPFWKYTKETDYKGKKVKITHEWLLDASLGRLNPDGVVEAVKKLSSAWNKYNTKAEKLAINKFAIKHGFSVQGKSQIPNKADYLAEKYINENNIDEDTVNTTFSVIRVVCKEVFRDMLKSSK